MPTTTTSFRSFSPAELARAMRDARDYTLALFDCFIDAGLDNPRQVPMLDIINPPLWEFGHVAWFAEWYILRDAESSHPGSAKGNSLLTKGDDWFDSNTVAHKSRWSLDLPGAGAMKTYCHEVLDRSLDKLLHADNSDAALYPYRLALAHEDMHGEAFFYTLQTLGIAPPEGFSTGIPQWPQGEISFPGGTLMLGSEHSEAFVFDNEKWAHACYVPPFVIDSAMVTNAQFAEFVADRGYEYPQFWSPAGRNWLMRQERSTPRGWQSDGGGWLAERFGDMHMLSPNEPVRHISLYEAQAYCSWARRRLPRESEWEFAAISGHPAFRWGDLWEWTCTPFEPYPGFVADAYREYSAPWFSSHQSVRGASFATRARMRSAKYRNFYRPERNDIFVGFRTCVL